MASNNNDLKRRRNSNSNDEDQADKKQRMETPLVTSSQPVQAINVELSSKEDYTHK